MASSYTRRKKEALCGQRLPPLTAGLYLYLYLLVLFNQGLYYASQFNTTTTTTTTTTGSPLLEFYDAENNNINTRVPGLVSTMRRHKRELSSNELADLSAAAGIAVQPLDNHNDLFYMSTITLGGQEFTVLIDTGSSDLWLASVDCESDACKSRRRFDPAKSRTLTYSNNRSIEILYGGDAHVRGVEAKDTLVLGGLVIKEQSFLLASELQVFSAIKLDGILGLGWVFASRLKALNPFERMIEYKLLKEPVFSLTLAAGQHEPGQGGQLVFGAGLSSSSSSSSSSSAGCCVRQYEYKNASLTRRHHWEFALRKVSLRSRMQEFELDGPPRTLLEVCAAGRVRCKAIADSGTPMITGSLDEVQQINGYLGAVDHENKGLFKFPNCSMTEGLPNLVFTISDEHEHELELTPEMYVYRTKGAGVGAVAAPVVNGTNGATLIQAEAQCYSGLTASHADQYSFWILGNVFLKHFNTLFDHGNKRVGFAHLHAQAGKK